MGVVMWESLRRSRMGLAKGLKPLQLKQMSHLWGYLTASFRRKPESRCLRKPGFRVKPGM